MMMTVSLISLISLILRYPENVWLVQMSYPMILWFVEYYFLPKEYMPLIFQHKDYHHIVKNYYFRADSPNMCSRWTEYIERASTLSIKDIYRLRYKLGNSDSQSAKVIAAKHRVSNEEFAIKIIDKRKCDQQMLQREIQILKQLSNPHIVELCDLFETRKYLYIVME